jgi:DNA-binding response OmpR family regulator
MARALVVASPSDTRERLSTYLQARAIQIFTVPSLSDARALLPGLRPDVTLLDRDAIDGDGIDLISSIVKTGSRCLIISERYDVQDRIRALTLGADDYLAKPINLEEFYLRLRNVLLNKVRPSYDRDKYIADFQGVQVELTTRALLNRDGSPGPELREGELSLLRVLTENINRIVTRDTLSTVLNQGFWDSQSRAVDVNVSRLRIKLNANGNEVAIRSVRSLGYIFMREDGSLEKKAPIESERDRS